MLINKLLLLLSNLNSKREIFHIQLRRIEIVMLELSFLRSSYLPVPHNLAFLPPSFLFHPSFLSKVMCVTFCQCAPISLSFLPSSPLLLHSLILLPLSSLPPSPSLLKLSCSVILSILHSLLPSRFQSYLAFTVHLRHHFSSLPFPSRSVSLQILTALAPRLIKFIFLGLVEITGVTFRIKHLCLTVSCSSYHHLFISFSIVSLPVTFYNLFSLSHCCLLCPSFIDYASFVTSICIIFVPFSPSS